MKVLIDAGFHKGVYTSSHANDFDAVYAFEPNPDFEEYGRYLTEKVIWSNKAVWINNGELEFYLASREDGGSVMDSKNNLTGENITVPCFDFSEWVMEKFTKHDYIEVKMDVEGAEFPVLQKMIDEYSVKWVDKFLIEFHTKRLGRKQYGEIEKKILLDLLNMGVQCVKRK